MLLSAVAVVWVVAGPPADTGVVGNSNVVGAFVGIAAFFAALAALRGQRPRAEDPTVLPLAPLSPEQERTAIDRLATEMLRSWREQAQLQGIRRGVAPVSMRWRWADEDVAAPPDDFRRFAADLPTSGAVQEFKPALYDALPTETRIVVLGASGAGKTGAMLVLLLDILAARKEGADEAVPVLLSVGGWNPRTPLLEWAAATIARDHWTAIPGVDGVQVVAELLRRERIALFLDGFDELPARLRGPALLAIDSQAAGLRVVLTSRREEYAAALGSGQLSLAVVVELPSPDLDAIEEFLVTGLAGARRRQWQQVAAHVRDHPHSVAATTLTTPLALALARQAYTQNGDPTTLIAKNRFPSSEALLQHLIACFLHQAYLDEPARNDALDWLTWIARHLGGRRDVAWWRIPAWLPARAYGLVYGVAAGAGVGLAAVFTAVFAFGAETEGALGSAVNSGWVLAVIIGVVVYLLVTDDAKANSVGALPSEDEPSSTHWSGSSTRMEPMGPRTLSFRRPRFRDFLTTCQTAWDRTLIGIAAALVSTMVFGFVELGQEVGERIVYGIAAGAAVALAAAIFGVAGQLFTSICTRPLTDSTTVTTPARTYGSAKAVNGAHVIVLCFAGAALGVVLLRYMPWSWTALSPEMRFATWLMLVVGLGGGFTIALMESLAQSPSSAILVAEYLLWIRHGRRVRFQKLLDKAVERQVLRQAGAVYQFRHAVIQDYLKSLYHRRLAESRLSRWLRPAFLVLVAAGLAAGCLAATIAVRQKPFLGLPAFRDGIVTVAFAPDGATIAAAGSDHKIRILDSATGAVVRTLTGHADEVRSVVYTRDGAMLASAGDDGTVRVWEIATGILRHRWDLDGEDHRIVFSPDGRTLAAGSRTSVRVWDTTTGHAVLSLSDQEGDVLAIGHSSGRTTVFTTNDRTGVFWDAASRHRIWSREDLDWPRTATISPQGSVIAVAGWDRMLFLDTVNGTEIRSIRDEAGSEFRAVAFSPDARFVAADTRDGVRVWNTATGQRLQQLRHPDGLRLLEGVDALAFSPDGSTLAGAVDQRVVLWRLDSGELIRSVCLATTYTTDSRYVGCEPAR
ncbi:hypothetical protein [Nonomuraea sp. JJY05]|uniref:hypothetical protein n=1 Tax=Nonomuraea sp. JJY05 TaxID=3350255 RepID=UPI00373F1A0C